MGCLVGGYKEKDMMPAEIFSEAVELEFEGEHFRAPKGYDTYLTIEYGDYMTLPPVEQRVTHHDFKALWKRFGVYRQRRKIKKMEETV